MRIQDAKRGALLTDRFGDVWRRAAAGCNRLTRGDEMCTPPAWLSCKAADRNFAPFARMVAAKEIAA